MRRKIIALSPLSFFANTSFKITYTVPLSSIELGTLKLLTLTFRRHGFILLSFEIYLLLKNLVNDRKCLLVYTIYI